MPDPPNLSIPVLYIRQHKTALFLRDVSSDSDADESKLGDAHLTVAEELTDPVKAAQAFGVMPDVLVVDMDSIDSRHADNNNDLIKSMLTRGVTCHVACGATQAHDALDLLDVGVERILVPDELLADAGDVFDQVPAERRGVLVSINAGDQNSSAESVVARMYGQAPRAVADAASVLAVILTDGAGRVAGVAQTALDWVREFVVACGKSPAGRQMDAETLWVGGGVASAVDVTAIDALGVRSLIGTALASNRMALGDAVSALLRSDRPDGLYPTIVVDEAGVALGLVYSDDASVLAALAKRVGIYHSRKRGLWEKGKTSGATQDLVRVRVDCDRDALQFVVHQHGAGFCHKNRRSCWSADSGLGKLIRTLESRRDNPVEKSYTNRLLNDKDLLRSKLLEEANELLEAETPEHVAFECADVIYFASVLLVRAGVPFSAVETNLDNKSRRIRRRKGDAKPSGPK